MPVTASRSPLRAVPLEDATADWDRLVEADGGATFCHLSAWRGVLEDVLGHECRYLAARDEEGRLRGVLPLVRVRSRLTGHHLISVPYLNYGGAVGSAEARRTLHAAALAEAGRLGVDRLEIRARSGVETGEAEGSGFRVGGRKVAVLLDLPDSAEVLWNDRFRSKLRSQIRKPQKEGLEARFGADQLEPFYGVFARNMRDLGTPVLPLAWFREIERRFGDAVVVAAVYRGDLPVGAGFGILWRGEFEITWASTLREHNALSPNMLLYWGMMEHVIGRGARVFNFGRSTPGAPTHRFKQQWGGVDLPLPWLEWPAGAEGDAEAAPSRLMEAASAAWRRLPLPVANRVGPFLARRLPWF